MPTLETFLPDPNFAISAHVLDNQTLWRQRSNAFKVLQTLTSTSTTMTYRHHPVMEMWRGAEYTLAMYGMAVCHEYRSRGHADDMTERFTAFLHDALLSGALPIQEHSGVPWWLGNAAFHDSEKAVLISQDRQHYGWLWPSLDMKFWRDAPRIWPAWKPPVRRGPEHDKYLSFTEQTIAK